MFVGAAYFIVAVLIPAFFIFVAKSDPTVKPGDGRDSWDFTGKYSANA